MSMKDISKHFCHWQIVQSFCSEHKDHVYSLYIELNNLLTLSLKYVVVNVKLDGVFQRLYFTNMGRAVVKRIRYKQQNYDYFNIQIVNFDSLYFLWNK